MMMMMMMMAGIKSVSFSCSPSHRIALVRVRKNVPQSSSLVYFRSSRVDVRLLPHPTERNLSNAVVKLLGKRWWIPIDARLEGPELEPEEPRAEVGFRGRRPGVFEHSRHSVWLFWHLNSVCRLQQLSTPSMDKCKWQISKTSCIEKNSQILTVQSGGSQQKGAGSKLYGGTGSVIRGSGSQTRGAGSEIRWDPPPNLTPDQATIYIVASCVETGALSVCSALFVFEVEGIPCCSIW